MMKGFAVFAVVLFLLSTQVTQAATLEEGWYVKLGLVDVRGWDGTSYCVIDWNFTGDLGMVGPFSVTSPDPVWARRMVSVDSTVSGIAPGTSVYLWGTPVTEVTFPITGVVPYYDTDYDASRMRLQLLMYHADAGYTILWEQNRSGVWGDAGSVLSQNQSIPIGYTPVFRVTVIPEPMSLIVLSSGLIALAFSLRRER